MSDYAVVKEFTILDLHTTSNSAIESINFLSNTEYSYEIGNPDLQSAVGSPYTTSSFFNNETTSYTAFIEYLHYQVGTMYFYINYECMNYGDTDLYLNCGFDTYELNGDLWSEINFDINCRAGGGIVTGDILYSGTDIGYNSLPIGDYILTMSRRTGGDFALKVNISAVEPGTGGRFLNWEMNQLYKSWYDGIKQTNYNNGYNSGYSQAIEESGEGTYNEGFKKGQEVGYQKAQEEDKILVNTFEVLREAVGVATPVLNTNITPNITLGQIAFLPVTVSVVIMIIRSLVA